MFQLISSLLIALSTASFLPVGNPAPIPLGNEYAVIWTNSQSGKSEVGVDASLEEARDFARSQIRFWSSAKDRPYCEEAAVLKRSGYVAVCRANTGNGYWFNWISGASTRSSATSKLLDDARRRGYGNAEIVQVVKVR